MKTTYKFLWLTALMLPACGQGGMEHDASGTFEATELIISAEAAGKVEVFALQEGMRLQAGQELGYIDSVQLHLKKMQLLAAQKAVKARRPNVEKQLAATKEQWEKAAVEQERVQRLLGDGAATQKQLDDVNSQVRVLEAQWVAQQNSLSTSVQSLNEESEAYAIQIAQVDDQIAKCRIINPINGTVLAKYTEAKEMTTPGKPLYKIADTEHLFLRAYVVSGQLEKLRIGSDAQVVLALSDGSKKSYAGRLVWISDKAEFSPKTIQTQDERQNLVYAVKIAVHNTDGLIKIGAYGEVDFSPRP